MTRLNLPRRRPGPVALVAGLFVSAAISASTLADQGQQNQPRRPQSPATSDQQTLQLPPTSPVVTISAMLPQELRVGEEFRYEIQVQNVSDNIAVHDLVLEQQTSQLFQIEESSVGQPGESQQTGNQQQQQQQQSQSQGQQQSQPSDRERAQQSQQQQQGQNAQQQAQSNRWTIGMLGPGETKTIHVRAIAEQEGQANACLSIASFRPALCIQTQFTKPDLELVKQAPDVANICDEIEIDYYVKNTGSGDAGQFTIRDPLPEGLETIEGEKELEFAVDGLQPNDVRKFVASLRATRSGEFSSRAVAELQEGGKTHSNNASTRVRQADLAVQIDGPQAQYINQPVSYTVLVANKGDAPARDATLSVRFPASADLVRVGDPQQAQASNVRQSESDRGQSPTAATRQNQQGRQQGQQQQQSQRQQSQQQSQQDPQRQQASQRDQSQESRQQNSQRQQDPQRQQQAQASQQSGQQSQHSQQPSQQRQTQQGEQQAQQDQRVWQIGTLEPGQAVRVNLMLRFREAKMVEAEAVAQFACGTDTGREQVDLRAIAMQQTELIALPDLMIAVVDNQGTVPQGEEVTYTIVVQNQGEAADQNVRINAELPQELEFVHADGPTDLKSEGNQLTFDPIDSLEPGQRAVYKVTAKAAGEGQVIFRTELSSDGMSRTATSEEPTQLFSRTASAPDNQ